MPEPTPDDPLNEAMESGVIELSSRRGRLRGVSLRALILGALTIVVLVTMFLVSLSVLNLMRQSLESSRVDAAKSLALAASSAWERDGERVPEDWVEDGIVAGMATVVDDRVESHGVTDHEVATELAAAATSSELPARIVRIGGERVVLSAALVGEGPTRVVISVDMAAIDKKMGSAQALVLLYLALVGVAVIFVGYVILTRSVVRPVRRLVRAVEDVGDEHLETSTRVGVGGVGEVAELSEAFDAMIERVRRARTAREESLRELAESNRTLIATNDALERARDSLVRSERLVSIGSLSAGVAHEIGNPISSILAYLEMLADEPEMELDERLEILERIERATQRIHKIIRELLDYSRIETADIAPADPANAVAQALSLAAPQPRLRGLEVVNELESGLAQALLDEHRLVQVILNLVLNAADALHSSKTESPTITITGEVAEEAVSIEVVDNGPGIPEDRLKDVFEPFYTTKAPGEGTGLGLAICDRVVSQMNGELSVESEPGETRFRIVLSRVKG